MRTFAVILASFLAVVSAQGQASDGGAASDVAISEFSSWEH